MKLTVCTFKRRRNGLTEWGVMINEEELIIDRDGKPVQMLYTYDLQPHEGCMVLRLDEPFTKSGASPAKEAAEFQQLLKEGKQP